MFFQRECRNELGWAGWLGLLGWAGLGCCILYSVFCILYSVFCILYLVCSTQYSVFCMLYSVCSVQYFHHTAMHYSTVQYNTLHYITVHYTTLDYTSLHLSLQSNAFIVFTAFSRLLPSFSLSFTSQHECIETHVCPSIINMRALRCMLSFNRQHEGIEMHVVLYHST